MNYTTVTTETVTYSRTTYTVASEESFSGSSFEDMLRSISRERSISVDETSAAGTGSEAEEADPAKAELEELMERIRYMIDLMMIREYIDEEDLEEVGYSEETDDCKVFTESGSDDATEALKKYEDLMKEIKRALKMAVYLAEQAGPNNENALEIEGAKFSKRTDGSVTYTTFSYESSSASSESDSGSDSDYTRKAVEA